jgi:hypothetical protein
MKLLKRFIFSNCEHTHNIWIAWKRNISLLTKIDIKHLLANLKCGITYHYPYRNEVDILITGINDCKTLLPPE